MTELSQFTAYIESEIKKIDFPKSPENLYDPLRYFLGLGGKRMRPVLTLMAANLFDVSKEECIPAALSLELFHNFSLIHDDIMDKAPLRRGLKTVHENWDTNIAILSGDVLLVKAYQLLGYYSDERLAALFELFNKTSVEVCEGQQMDMDFEKRDNVSAEEYIEMIRLKTSVLVGCAFEFGGIVANQSNETRKHLYNFGENLGLAFQIQDDLLDLYGTSEQIGKQVGGDVLANKKTLLLIEALKNEPEQVNKLLFSTNDAEKIRFAQNLFQSSGSKAKCEALIEFYFDKAHEALSAIKLEDSKKVPLVQLAEFLISRAY